MQSPKKSECTAQKCRAQHHQTGNELGVPASEGACLNTFTSAVRGRRGGSGEVCGVYDSGC